MIQKKFISHIKEDKVVLNREEVDLNLKVSRARMRSFIEFYKK
jgi:hypothetical protein